MTNQALQTFRFCPKRKCTLNVRIHSGTIQDDNTADVSYFNGNGKVLDNLRIVMCSREHPQDTMHRVTIAFPGTVDTGDTKKIHLDELRYANGQKCHDPFLYLYVITSVVITYTDGASITFEGNMLEDARIAGEKALRDRVEQKHCESRKRALIIGSVIVLLALLIVGLLVGLYFMTH